MIYCQIAAIRRPLCSWWRHQMETFCALLAICAGNSPVPGEFPAQRPVTRSFYVFFDLRLNKRLGKQSWGWWFERVDQMNWYFRSDSNSMRLSFSSHSVCDGEIMTLLLLWLTVTLLLWLMTWQPCCRKMYICGRSGMTTNEFSITSEKS